MRLLNTLTHSHSLTHSQCTCSHVITSTECHPKCRFRAASAPNRLLYSPDMAPCSDFYILSNIFDSEAKGIHERTDSSLLTTRMLSTLLMDQCQEFFYSGIRSLGKRSVKGVSVAGDYFEKWHKITCAYTLCSKKEATKLLAITFSNLNRFSKFFHCWK